MGEEEEKRNIANKAYRSLSSSPLSAPAAAPVLAGAAPLAPKPNPPPAIMYASQKNLTMHSKLLKM
jgi:hypothetical protein